MLTDSKGKPIVKSLIEKDTEEASQPASEDRYFDLAPCGAFIVVERFKIKEKMTGGGILLPDNLNEKAGAFKVIAAGPGFLDEKTGTRMPMSVKVGDYVLIDVARVVNCSYAGQEMLICMDSDVYGVVQFRKGPGQVSS